MGFRRPFEFAFTLWPLFSDDLLSLVGSYVTPLCRHSRAGGNPFLVFGNCFSNIGFLTLYADSRRSLFSRRWGWNNDSF